MSAGENELFDVRDTAPGSFMDIVQRFLKSSLGFTLPNAVGQGLLWGK
jgi:hypothetical protein